MKKYKVKLHIVDEIEANTKEEAERIFWDRFDNAFWKAEVKEKEE